jgi:6,7-dimethyl-8-ribityllumazine synthase
VEIIKMHKGQPIPIEGRLIATGLHFAIVVSRFNESITTKLLDGCLDTLHRHGANKSSIETIWCPGAFEIPFVAKQAALANRFDAIICLGAVIRGETPHFDYVCEQATRGIGQVGLETNVPIIFGVLTTDNMEQALDRVGGKSGHKGSEAAAASIEMVNLMHDLQRRFEPIESVDSLSKDSLS